MASFAARSLPFARSIRFFSQTRRNAKSCSASPSSVVNGSLRARSSTAPYVPLDFRWGLGIAFTTTRELSKAAKKRSGHLEGERGSIRSLADDAVAVAEEDEDEDGAQERESRSKNQRKRDSTRARHWGVELASCTPAQVKQAVRWAGLTDEVYDAVILVKNLGTSKVRNGRRRQLNYIGGLLRDVDPDVMEPVLKAAKNGDSEGIMFNSPLPTESTEEEESWAEEGEEEEEDPGEEDGIKLVAEGWLEGMIAGSSATEDEVYSIFYVEFDRQELRKLVRTAQKSSADEGKGDGSGSRKSHAKLRSFLINIARQQAETQAMYS